MNFSPTPAELTALRVANAAVQASKSPNSHIIDTAVFALGSAGLLQSPESAAELVALRAERDAFREQRNTVFRTNEELLARVERAELDLLHVQNENRTLTRRVAELEAGPAIRRLGPSKATRLVQGALAEQREDPHDSPLHHAYRLGHDLEATS